MLMLSHMVLKIKPVVFAQHISVRHTVYMQDYIWRPQRTLFQMEVLTYSPVIISLY